MKRARGFASDNNAGVHPALIEAIAKVNDGHALAYGYDDETKRAVTHFKKHFGDDIDVYFVFNGTGANVLALKALTDSYHAIICSDTAHIYEDECGAPEKFTGCKLFPIHVENGKLTVEKLRHVVNLQGSEHKVQPRVVSLTQTTEYGTVYQPHEIRALCDFAHQHGMYVHMDGARIANAAATLGMDFKSFTRDVGVDVLSFGGTKIGLMFGEAVVFFKPELGRQFKFIRKHGMQLPSKMRFIAAQFSALFENELWLHNARHANAMAQRLAKKLEAINGVRITQKVEANGVFAILAPEAIKKLREKYFFHTWDESKNEVRWMTSFDTTESDVDAFVEAVALSLS